MPGVFLLEWHNKLPPRPTSKICSSMTCTLASLPRFTFALPSTAILLGAALLAGGVFVGEGILATPALAQEDATQSKKHESTHSEVVDWYKVTLIKFKSGKQRKALSMIERFWDPASDQADAPSGAEATRQAEASGQLKTPEQVEKPMPTVVEMPRGPWNVMLIYPLEKRPVEMRWKSPAELEELQRALRESLVGEEAEKTWKVCKRLIDRSTSFVGFSGLRGRTFTGRE